MSLILDFHSDIYKYQAILTIKMQVDHQIAKYWRKLKLTLFNNLSRKEWVVFQRCKYIFIIICIYDETRFILGYVN